MSIRAVRSIASQGTPAESGDLLVFLPPAGAVISPFFPIGSCLVKQFSVLHCEIPGRGRLAEWKSPGSIGELVDLWAEEIQAYPWAGQRIFLVGHSLGAVFGYELALRLAADTRLAVAGLIVSAASAPKKLPEDWSVAAFRRLGPDGQSGALPVAESWLWHDLTLRQRYEPAGHPLDAALALLSGRDDAFMNVAGMNDWRYLVRGQWLGHVKFDGDHDYCQSRSILVGITILNLIERSVQVGRAVVAGCAAKGDMHGGL